MALSDKKKGYPQGIKPKTSVGDTLPDTLSKTPGPRRTAPDQGISGYLFNEKEKWELERDRLGASNRAHEALWEVDTLDTLRYPAPGARPRRLNPSSARRTQRSLTQQTAAAALWWASYPEPRPLYLSTADLELATGIPILRATRALRALGWRCITSTIAGQKATRWLPPGSPTKARPIGRPRVYPCE